MIRILVLASAFLLVASSMSFACRGEGGSRACWANLRTLDGAIEMYNLDKNLRVFDGEPRLLTAHELKPLIEGGYLQSVPADPGQGSGDHYLFVPRLGGTVCLVHGAPQTQTTARDQLRQLGVTDEALLETALDTMPQDRSTWELTREQFTGFIGLLFLALEGFRLRVMSRWSWFQTVVATAAVLGTALATASGRSCCAHEDSNWQVAVTALLLATFLTAGRALGQAALRRGVSWYCRRPAPRRLAA